MNRFFLFVYYFVIAKLPNSRFFKVSNKVRVWYLYKVLKVLKGMRGIVVEENVYLSSGSNRVVIGEFSQINENVFLQGATIGSHVMIAPNVSILSSSHNYADPSIPIVFQGTSEKKPVIIEDDVWIGRSAIIMPGIHIGKGAVIGAGAVVTKNVGAYSVMGGVPAKLIRRRC